MNDLTFQIQEKGIVDSDVIASLIERGVTHLYIGQLQGRGNWTGPVLEPKQLLGSSHFHPIYHEDRVWVFEFVP